MGRIDDRYYRKAYRRLSKLDSGTVQQWAENTLWATQAAFEGYRAHRDEGALDEARRGASGLLACAQVLLDREVKGEAH